MDVWKVKELCDELDKVLDTDEICASMTDSQYDRLRRLTNLVRKEVWKEID